MLLKRVLCIEKLYKILYILKKKSVKVSWKYKQGTCMETERKSFLKMETITFLWMEYHTLLLNIMPSQDNLGQFHCVVLFLYGLWILMEFNHISNVFFNDTLCSFPNDICSTIIFRKPAFHVYYIILYVKIASLNHFQISFAFCPLNGNLPQADGMEILSAFSFGIRSTLNHAD